MKITRFEDIQAWQEARKLTWVIYEASRKFLCRDLQRQVRRAAVSMMSNIAEGFDSGSDLEFRRFLRIAVRSGTEVQSHLYVAFDQGYLDQHAFDRIYAMTTSVKRLSGGFIKYLTKDLGQRTKN
jgi:four helix bundle protein